MSVVTFVLRRQNESYLSQVFIRNIVSIDFLLSKITSYLLMLGTDGLKNTNDLVNYRIVVPHLYLPFIS